MTIYIDYDPTEADANNYVGFVAISIADNPDPSKNHPPGLPPSPQLQITFPDGTEIDDKVLDLNFNPPVLIDAPFVPNPAPAPSPSPGG